MGNVGFDPPWPIYNLNLSTLVYGHFCLGSIAGNAGTGGMVGWWNNWCSGSEVFRIVERQISSLQTGFSGVGANTIAFIDCVR